MTNLAKDGKANDTDFMRAAIIEGQRAEAIGEVPIGAVAVVDGQIIARSHNMREATGNPLGHAEILLIQKLTDLVTPASEPGSSNFGCRVIPGMTEGSWRLTNVTVYVTCEPCLMCMGAMLQARIPRVVYGCRDPKAGACGSLYDVSNDSRLNHRIEVLPDVLSQECGQMLSNFFKARRK